MELQENLLRMTVGIHFGAGFAVGIFCKFRYEEARSSHVAEDAKSSEFHRSWCFAGAKSDVISEQVEEGRRTSLQARYHCGRTPTYWLPQI